MRPAVEARTLGMAAVPRKQGRLTSSNTRGVLCSICPGKMHASVPRAWLPMSAGVSQTGAIRGGGTEFAIMTRNLFSSWAQPRELSSAVIYVDSVLVMGWSDGAKVMARLGWTESEKQHLEAALQGRQHEFGWRPTLRRCWLIGIRPTGSQFKGPRNVRSTLREYDLEIPLQMPCSPSPSLGFAESWRSGSGRRVCCPRSCSREGSWTLPPISPRSPPPIWMISLYLPVISDTAAALLPRVALATHVTMETAREHGLQPNMASNKTEVLLISEARGDSRFWKTFRKSSLC